MRDILVRLRRDAGQLTLAELIQERQAAACEIERLRNQQDRSNAVIPAMHVWRSCPPPRARRTNGSPVNWAHGFAYRRCANS
jgi:hypothetical protein